MPKKSYNESVEMDAVTQSCTDHNTWLSTCVVNKQKIKRHRAADASKPQGGAPAQQHLDQHPSTAQAPGLQHRQNRHQQLQLKMHSASCSNTLLKCMQ
jgi:hypothetical protein